MSDYRVPNPSYDPGARSDDPNSEQFLTRSKKRKMGRTGAKRKRAMGVGADIGRSTVSGRVSTVPTLFPNLANLPIRSHRRGG